MKKYYQTSLRESGKTIFYTIYFVYIKNLKSYFKLKAKLELKSILK